MAVIVSVAAIFVPAIILGKIIEGIVFFFCHWFIREQYPMQYHHIVPATCRLITSCVFFFGVCMTCDFALSALSAIPINYMIAWVGFTKKSEEKYRYECEKMRAKYCTELENLLARCKNAMLSKRDTEIAIRYYYQHQTPKEIWLWLCDNKEFDSIEWDSVYKTIHRIGKKL